ncbi:MAG: type II toxin-antitoxin system PemK/MazF family toxin [Nostoc sp.]|uniref:type II toxin-antitoxin system PemK/MazF family toxin n=1 Tax=Nostoc sp. TaxID=1180 RepID=UPI002FFD0B86
MTQPKQTFKRGDVVLVLFPNSNLTTAKTRPALIVQADNLQTGLPQVIVAMITSQMFRAGYPCRQCLQAFSLDIDLKTLLQITYCTKLFATVAFV